MSTLPAGAIVFENVSKRYRLGALGTLRSTLSALASRGSGVRDFWALRDVSFRVEPGESLGLIGPNGAGKTTTLRLLSNITRPTTGRVAAGGRISSLIELGAGFHPELSGRDNIFLNGAILGLKRRDIQRKLDAIIAFSELERFIDTPVKRYSSGMYVRLGFAVAAHVEPDILLVDEVLAVGDAAFRQKCLERMNGLLDQGATVIFVSHNMYLVRRLCANALLLRGGEAVYLGPAEAAIQQYELALEPAPTAAPDAEGAPDPGAGGACIITRVSLTAASGEQLSQLSYDDDAVVRIAYRTREPIPDPIVKIRLMHSDGTVAAMAASRYQAGASWTLSGEGVIRVRLRPIQLASGTYHVEARILDTTDSAVLAGGRSASFRVSGPSLPHELDRGSYVPNTRWEHEAGSSPS